MGKRIRSISTTINDLLLKGHKFELLDWLLSDTDKYLIESLSDLCSAWLFLKGHTPTNIGDCKYLETNIMTSFDSFLGYFKDPRYNFKIQPLLSELFYCYNTWDPNFSKQIQQAIRQRCATTVIVVFDKIYFNLLYNK